MNLELIKDKLAGARYFLGALEDEKAKQARPNKPPPAHFRYNLSAFMTAARSVTDLIERGGKQTWRKQLNATEKALHDLAKKMRGNNVHKGRIETIPRAEEVPIRFAPDVYQSGHPHFRAQVLAMGSCDEYVALLARVVSQTMSNAGP